jgi:hypothetical protein
LESPLHGPAIAPYVRELHIVEGYGSEAWFNEGLPVMCMGVLPSVTWLRVKVLQWEKLSGESRPAFMSFLRNVQEENNRLCSLAVHFGFRSPVIDSITTHIPFRLDPQASL